MISFYNNLYKKKQIKTVTICNLSSGKYFFLNIKLMMILIMDEFIKQKLKL
jgi:hypothetical protein